MRTHIKLVLTATAAALVLAAAVGTASARNLEVSNQSIRVVWTPLTFNGGAAGTIECNVTLEGTFVERTIAKVLGTLIGRVTRAIVGRPCVGGTAWAYNGTETNEVLGGTLATSLPWHITYQGFTGTLPRITSIRLLLIGAHFLLRKEIGGFPLLCNYTTTTTEPAEGIAEVEAGGAVGNLRADETRRIRSESGGLCPTGNFQNSGPVTLLGTTNRIIIRLI